MTVVYTPDSDLVVDGNASKVDTRCKNADVEVIGSTASVDGDVSYILVSSELSETELNNLKTEFGVSWSKETSYGVRGTIQMCLDLARSTRIFKTRQEPILTLLSGLIL